MRQLASNHVPPSSESSSYSDDVHSSSSEKSASGAAVALRYVVYPKCSGPCARRTSA